MVSYLGACGQAVLFLVRPNSGRLISQPSKVEVSRLMSARISVSMIARMIRKPSMPVSTMVVTVSSRYPVTQRRDVCVVFEDSYFAILCMR
jgi:hypothetical protein